MSLPFDLLPIEVQASVLELRAAGVSESTITMLMARTVAALGIKSNIVQVEVWQIGEQLREQLTQIGVSLHGNVQTQLGAINEMLSEVRNAQLHAHPQITEALAGIAALKKDWSELEEWRGRVEATIGGFMESRDLSLAERKEFSQALTKLDERLTLVEHVIATVIAPAAST